MAGTTVVQFLVNGKDTDPNVVSKYGNTNMEILLCILLYCK